MAHTSPALWHEDRHFLMISLHLTCTSHMIHMPCPHHPHGSLRRPLHMTKKIKFFFQITGLDSLWYLCSNDMSCHPCTSPFTHSQYNGVIPSQLWPPPILYIFHAQLFTIHQCYSRFLCEFFIFIFTTSSCFLLPFFRLTMTTSLCLSWKSGFKRMIV